MKYPYKSLFFKIYPPIFVDTFDTLTPIPFFFDRIISLVSMENSCCQKYVIAILCSSSSVRKEGWQAWPV